MRISIYYLLVTIGLAITTISCDKPTTENEKHNQLYVTDKGDSLETGFWIFEPGTSGVSKSGNFKDGFRDGVWTYKTTTDSVSVKWTVFTNDSLKLNLPDQLTFSNQEAPVIFLGTIGKDNEHSYYTLLKYDLKQINASIYDYVFQYIQSLENSTVERLTAREVKKFNFKTTEILRVKVNLEGDQKYQATSYLFTHNDILYDLTYREEVDKVSDIELEIFNDVLYSFQTNDFDPFGFNNKHYSEMENVDVRTPVQN